MFQSNFLLVEKFQGITINKLQIFKLLSLQINQQELKQRKSIKKFEFSSHLISAAPTHAIV